MTATRCRSPARPNRAPRWWPRRARTSVRARAALERRLLARSAGGRRPHAARRSRPPTAPATPPACSARSLVDATPPQLTLTGIEKVETDDTPKADVIATDAAGTPTREDDARRSPHPHPEASEPGQDPLRQAARGPAHARRHGHRPRPPRDDRQAHASWSTAPRSSARRRSSTAPAAATSRRCSASCAPRATTTARINGVLGKRTVAAVKRFQTRDRHPGRRRSSAPRCSAACRAASSIVQSEHRLYFYLNGKLKKDVPGGDRPGRLPHAQRHHLGRLDDQRPDLDAARLAVGGGRQAGRARVPTTRSACAGSAPASRAWASTACPSSEDYSIGTYASHGCIRMYEWDVEQLYDMGHGRHADHHQAVAREPAISTHRTPSERRPPVADIRPFRGLRYDTDRVALADAVCPPYDVIAPAAAAGAARGAAPTTRSTSSCPVADRRPRRPLRAPPPRCSRAWRADGVLRADDEPSLYLVEQSFTGPDGRRAHAARLRLPPAPRGLRGARRAAPREDARRHPSSTASSCCAPPTPT